MNKIKTGNMKYLLSLFNVKQRTFSSSNINTLECKWHDIMYIGWDVVHPLDVRFNWLKMDYEFYFVAEYVG